MSKWGTASCARSRVNTWGQNLTAHHDPIPCMYTLTMSQWMTQMITRWQRPVSGKG